MKSFSTYHVLDLGHFSVRTIDICAETDRVKVGLSRQPGCDVTDASEVHNVEWILYTMRKYLAESVE